MPPTHTVAAGTLSICHSVPGGDFHGRSCSSGDPAIPFQCGRGQGKSCCWDSCATGMCLQRRMETNGTTNSLCDRAARKPRSSWCCRTPLEGLDLWSCVEINYQAVKSSPPFPKHGTGGNGFNSCSFQRWEMDSGDGGFLQH